MFSFLNHRTPGKALGRFLAATLVLWLFPHAAQAALSLEIIHNPVAAESPVDFTVSGDPAPLYRYTLYHDGETLFETESQYAAGSYLPRDPGEYTLEVTAQRERDEESARATFTVVERLSFSLNEIPGTLCTGEPLKVEVTAEGGSGSYRYLYSVVSQDGTSQREEGGASWHWIAGAAGDYALHVTVMDSQGALLKAQRSFSVSEGEPRIIVEKSGGGLSGHGGQESWTVYAPGPWIASTEDGFFTLETSSGDPGDPLTVTAMGETGEYLEGSIRITSGSLSVDWPVSQSAGHGVDEEVFLFTEQQPVYVDGSEHVCWTDAQGARSFQVTAPGPWEADTESAFLHLEAAGNVLTVTVDAADEAAVRSGLVTVTSGLGTAYIHVYQLPGPGLPQAATALPEDKTLWDGLNLYSQFSGLWKEKPYGSSTLEHSGCAIFALSHALQWLGFEGEAILPEALAKKYAFCLRDGATINSTLVGNAGDDLGFKTRYDLYTNLSTIRSKLEEGAVFSFAVVSDHIAMVAEQSEDGSMMRIIDSAPSATWDRIGDARLYRQETDGSFVPISSLSELNGIRYYIETGAFGAATYWLEADYVARRGVRLIQPEEPKGE